MTFAQQTQTLLEQVSFNDYAFEVTQEGDNFFLRAVFPAKCNKTGEWAVQHTRKWRLSPHMTNSEVVQTAFKCVLTSIEHEAREQFLYKDAAIFGPHYDVDVLADLVKGGKSEEVRQPPPEPRPWEASLQYPALVHEDPTLRVV